MSTERYEITDDGASIIIAESNGTRSTIDPVDGQHLDDAVIGAIRQQARDLDQLRSDLAAAAAERDKKEGRLLALYMAYCAVTTELDTLRARLAAIVGAPSIAVVSVDVMGVSLQMSFQNSHSRTATTTTELIARPAKD